MIKEELYKRTTDILYQAYFDNTLKHGDCACCAVGNLVALNNGFKIVEHKHEEAGWVGRHMFFDGKNLQPPKWNSVFCTFNYQSHKRQEIEVSNYFGLAKIQIDSTGYTWEDLAKIEYAFETADKGESKEDHMFNGLVKVLEVLRDIHQVTDEDLIQGNNKRFKDHYQKRLTTV